MAAHVAQVMNVTANTPATPFMVAEPGRTTRTPSRATSTGPASRTLHAQGMNDRMVLLEERLDTFASQTITAFQEAKS